MDLGFFSSSLDTSSADPTAISISNENSMDIDQPPADTPPLPTTHLHLIPPHEPIDPTLITYLQKVRNSEIVSDAEVVELLRLVNYDNLFVLMQEDEIEVTQLIHRAMHILTEPLLLPPFDISVLITFLTLLTTFQDVRYIQKIVSDWTASHIWGYLSPGRLQVELLTLPNPTSKRYVARSSSILHSLTLLFEQSIHSGALDICQPIVEFYCSLLSGLKTRRYLRAYLLDRHVLVTGFEVLNMTRLRSLLYFAIHPVHGGTMNNVECLEYEMGRVQKAQRDCYEMCSAGGVGLEGRRGFEVFMYESVRKVMSDVEGCFKGVKSEDLIVFLNVLGEYGNASVASREYLVRVLTDYFQPFYRPTPLTHYPTEQTSLTQLRPLPLTYLTLPHYTALTHQHYLHEYTLVVQQEVQDVLRRVRAEEASGGVVFKGKGRMVGKVQQVQVLEGLLVEVESDLEGVSVGDCLFLLGIKVVLSSEEGRVVGKSVVEYQRGCQVVKVDGCNLEVLVDEEQMRLDLVEGVYRVLSSINLVMRRERRVDNYHSVLKSVLCGTSWVFDLLLSGPSKPVKAASKADESRLETVQRIVSQVVSRQGLHTLLTPHTKHSTDIVRGIVHQLVAKGERVVVVARSNEVLDEVMKAVAVGLDGGSLVRLGYTPPPTTIPPAPSRTPKDSLGVTIAEKRKETITGFEPVTSLISKERKEKEIEGIEPVSFVPLGTPKERKEKEEKEKKEEGLEPETIRKEKKEKGGIEPGTDEDRYDRSGRVKYFLERRMALLERVRVLLKVEKLNSLESAGYYLNNIKGTPSKELDELIEEVKTLQPFEVIKSLKDLQSHILYSHTKVVFMTSTQVALNEEYVRYENIVVVESDEMVEMEMGIVIGRDDVKRVVMIGDIEGSVQSISPYLDLSFFKRMLRLGVEREKLTVYSEGREDVQSLFKGVYERQFGLEEHTIPQGLLQPYQFIHTAGPLTTPRPHSLQNLHEAEFLISIYQYLRLSGHPSSSIVLISSEAGQRDLLLDIMKRRCEFNPLFGKADIRRTLKRPRDIVLISLTHHCLTPAFVEDIGRITRNARKGLYVVGNGDIFKSICKVNWSMGLEVEGGGVLGWKELGQLVYDRTVEKMV